MKRTFITFLSATTCFFMYSCVNDNFEELSATIEKTQTVDSLGNVITSFSTDVLPIVNNNCTPCHGEGGFLPLNNFDAFSSSASSALSAVESGYMPQDRPKLSDSDIETIKNWIDEGKQNN